MVFVSDEQCVIWSQKMCPIWVFHRSGGSNLKDVPLGVLLTQQTLKKLNFWEKTAVEKSAWINACIASDEDIYSLNDNNTQRAWTPLPPPCATLPASHLPHQCVKEASWTYFHCNIFDVGVFTSPQCFLCGFSFHSYLLNFTPLICLPIHFHFVFISFFLPFDYWVDYFMPGRTQLFS